MNILSAPYPFEQTARGKWAAILATSSLMGLLLLLLQPFGFSAFKDYWRSSVYFLIMFGTLTINYFGFPYFFSSLFKEKEWTVWKAILWLTYNFVVIGSWIHLFNTYNRRFRLDFFISFEEIGITLFRTFIIGIIASILWILSRYNYLARKHLEIAQNLNQKLKAQLSTTDSKALQKELIVLQFENQKLSFSRKNLIFLVSESNYVRISYLKNDKVSQQLIRGRIKQMEKDLIPYKEFFRCHRAFIINLNFVASTTGNSQGLKLKLSLTDQLIPVSRSHVKKLRQLIAPF